MSATETETKGARRLVARQAGTEPFGATRPNTARPSALAPVAAPAKVAPVRPVRPTAEREV